ncbi:hypothetical protein ABIC99_002107 [Sphaerotilus sulfidivorans]|uniref:GGDEF domain-containing protein n=1 Tax=Sphaerotilus sulfidivorans TaxID=639200 RepID=A0ABV2INA5_9BURK|nr:diguanylate cyclase [Sphaerotilus sulfidivorans]NZD47714.1 diguanylate cyclase [Sphaerotilus sulfidivorans]
MIDPVSGRILQSLEGGLHRPALSASFAGTDLVLPLTLAPGETVRLLLMLLHVLLWPLAIWRQPISRPDLRSIRLSLTLCFAGMQAYLLLMHSHDWLPDALDLLSTLAWIDYMALLCVLHICAVSWRSDRRRRHRDLEFLALHDALTGLPNRVKGIGQLRQALQQQEERRPQVGMGMGVGVLCMDLNGFKQINDTYGHARGDQLLCQPGGAPVRGQDRPRGQPVQAVR